MDIYEAQKEALRFYRKANGLTQKELGRRTFISKESIGAYENRSIIPLDKLEVVCSAFGITIADFFEMVQVILDCGKENRC